MKLALGTVRFGMNYGIGYERNKIALEKAHEILNAAFRSGIDVIDTAYAYEESEKVIGGYLRAHPDTFKVISKFPKYGHADVEKILTASLKHLGVKALYGYLIRHFDIFMKDGKLWDEFKRLKSEGRIGKIGFTLYYPSELETLLEKRVAFDIIQIPLNVLDQRFLPYLRPLKDRGVEVHARSVYLQGLLLKKPEDLPAELKGLREKISALRGLSQRAGIPLEAICLSYVTQNSSIDKAVVGIGSLEHIRSNLSALGYEPQIRKIRDEIRSLKETEADLIVPSRWKLKNLKQPVAGEVK